MGGENDIRWERLLREVIDDEIFIPETIFDLSTKVGDRSCVRGARYYVILSLLLIRR